MLASFLIPLFPVAICLLGFFVPAALAVFVIKRRNRNRWSPLTFKLLRNPGHTLLTEMESVDENISSYLLALFIAPLLTFVVHVSTSYFSHQSESWGRIGMNATVYLVMEAYFVVKLLKLTDQKRRLREGFEAESAVGSELNQLMLDGAHVFHDLQADHFNIDHIVVSSKGVFCVETKSRVKYLASEGKTNANVEFDGSALKFPSHIETAPIEQSRANAKWLKEWLTQATGEEIKVCPVLALPGWFINRTARSDVIVINGKNCRPIFSKLTAHQTLSEAQIQRVAFQLENRCRDIEPTRYRKAEKKLVAV